MNVHMVEIDDFAGHTAFGVFVSHDPALALLQDRFQQSRFADTPAPLQVKKVNSAPSYTLLDIL
jgi:hypothetical protein